MEKTINLVQFLNGVEAVTIEDGERLNEEIKGCISDGSVVILDFDGIESCVTRFLNPAIGRLFQAFDNDTLGKYVEFKNLRPAHADKLRAVISNARKFYSDPIYKAAVKEALENA